jgi:hypothetical protein
MSLPALSAQNKPVPFYHVAFLQHNPRDSFSIGSDVNRY